MCSERQEGSKRMKEYQKEYPKKQEKCSREHESEGQTKGRHERLTSCIMHGFISSEVD